MQTIGTRTMLGCAMAMAAGCAAADKRAGAEPAAMDAGASATTVPHRCDYAANTFLTVDENDFAEKCLSPRGEAKDIVRIPKQAADFASRCAIKLIQENVSYVPPTHACASSARPLQVGDELMVTELRANKFALTRFRAGDPLVIPLEPGDTREKGTPYLYGTDGDITYFVYINFVQGTGGRFDKHYRFEVFDRRSKDPTECDKHKPTSLSQIEACAIIPGPAYGSQTGTSTGGEPPPK